MSSLVFIIFLLPTIFHVSSCSYALENNHSLSNNLIHELNETIYKVVPAAKDQLQQVANFWNDYVKKIHSQTLIDLRTLVRLVLDAAENVDHLSPNETDNCELKSLIDDLHNYLPEKEMTMTDCFLTAHENGLRFLTKKVVELDEHKYLPITFKSMQHVCHDIEMKKRCYGKIMENVYNSNKLLTTRIKQHVLNTVNQMLEHERNVDFCRNRHVETTSQEMQNEMKSVYTCANAITLRKVERVPIDFFLE